MMIALSPNQVIATKTTSYVIKKQIGKGQFGLVYLAFNQATQEEVAIKQVHKFHLDNPKVNELFHQEIKIQSSLNSQHLVSVKEVIDHIQTKSYLIVQEYCQDGDLQQYINKCKHIPERQAIAFFKQILAGFKDLHAKNYMHRDVKASNIFLHLGKTKLGDFGFAKQLNNGDIAKTSLGSYITMAPEVFNSEDYSFEADMYSLGIVFYQMLFGQYPYTVTSTNAHALFQAAKAENIDFKKNNISVSSDVEDLIRRMMKFDRKQRITFTEIYKHPVIMEQRRFPEEVMDLSIIASDKVFNPAANQDFYAQNDYKLSQLSFSQKQNKYPILPNPNNNNNQIKNDDIKIEISESDQEQKAQEEQQKQNELKQKLLEERKKEYEMAMKMYIHKRNLYGILIQMLDHIRNLKDFKINYQIPAFLTIKKLIHMIKEYNSILQNKENIFQLKYFQDFSQAEDYQNLIGLSLADLAKVRIQYPTILNECKESIKKLRINDKQLFSHLESEECNDKFAESYKACLINYSIGLREQQRKDKTVQQRNLFQHVVIISDIARIDTFEKKNFDFNFEKYKVDVYNTPFEEFDNKYDQACMRIFD